MSNDKDTLREEYDPSLIKSGERGKYAERFRAGTNVVVIDPELHQAFPTSEAVNKALREILEQQRRTDA